MEYRLTIYALLHIPALVMTLAAIPFLWSRRNVPGLKYLALLEVSVAAWIAAAGLELAATTVPLKFFWSQMCYVGAMPSPSFLLLFATEYTQPRKPWGWRRVVPLFIVPVLVCAAIFTDTLRPLYWPSLTIDPVTNIGVYGHGPAFWPTMAYIYTLIAIALLTLFARLLRLRAYFRSQIAIFALASAFPIFANFLYLTGLNPIRGMDWTPIAFGFMSIVLAWGALQHEAFRLIPVAHERLSESVPDAIIIVDLQNRIVELNPAARRIFGRAAESIVGRPAHELIGSTEQAARLLESEDEKRVEVSVNVGGVVRTFDAYMSPVRHWRGHLTGRLLGLRDITDYKRLEQEREGLIRGLQEALAHVKTLRGLLPICANCKRIRDDEGYWHEVELYITQHSDAGFTHGICPDCARKLYPEVFSQKPLSEQER